MDAQDLYFDCANWLRLALSHNQDIPAAQFLMGQLYEKGLSVEVNLKAAFDCYSLSASLGHSKGHLKLGNCYYTGIKEPITSSTNMMSLDTNVDSAEED
jgi:TPR repeat protein